jgi:hypothetical protein
MTILATACATEVKGEPSEGVVASEVTTQNLGVEQWVVYPEAGTGGLRVVGMDAYGSSLGEVAFSLTSPYGDDYELLNTEFGDGAMVIDPDGNVVSNTLYEPEWNPWIDAANSDLESEPQLQALSCTDATIGAAAACVGGAYACSTLVGCFVGATGCYVGLKNAHSTCYPEEELPSPPPPDDADDSGDDYSDDTGDYTDDYSDDYSDG